MRLAAIWIVAARPLLLLALAIRVQADEPPTAVRLAGTRWVNPTADEAQMLAWADAQHDVNQASGRQLGEAERAELAETLAKAAAPMGRSVPWTSVLDRQRIQHIDGGEDFRARADGEGLFAKIEHANRTAQVMALAFKRQREASLFGVGVRTLTFVSVDGEPERTIFGLPCRAYDVSGNGAGRVWIHVPPAARIAVIRELVANATRTFGRLDAEPIYAAAVQLGGIPVLGRIDGTELPAFTGNSVGRRIVLACWTIEDATLADADTAVPDGYAQKHIPPR